MTKKATRKKPITKKTACKKAAAEDLGGRPTKYNKRMNEAAYKYSLLGATDKKLGEFLGVTEKTINNWKHIHPGFLQSINEGKFIADSLIAESMYQRAMGYTHPEEKIFQHDGEIIRAETTKHYPPDTQAASLWLRNRQPEKWRDKTEHVVHKPEKEEELTGPELQAACDELEKKIRDLETQL